MSDVGVQQPRGQQGRSGGGGGGIGGGAGLGGGLGGGHRGGGKATWREVTSFKIKAILLLVVAGILWVYGTGWTEIFIVLFLAGCLLALAHPWKMKGGRALNPEVVACMIGVAVVLTFALTFSILVGVPGLATWVDQSGRTFVHLPTPTRELPHPWEQATTTLPAIPG